MVKMLEECAEWQENANAFIDDDDGDLLSGQKGASYKRTVGLIFAGDGVDAASVILPRNIKNASKQWILYDRILGKQRQPSQKNINKYSVFTNNIY